MLKKLLAVLIAAAMVLGLVGCNVNVTPSTDNKPAAEAEENEQAAEPAEEGGEEAAPEGISHDEEYMVEFYDSYANYMGEMTGWYAKIVKDKFNLTFNLICPNIAGTGDQLYTTRTAAGNLGDLIVQVKTRMIDCYNVGLLGSMSPYLPNCPNLLKLETAYEAFREAMGSEEVYAIPGWVSNNPDDQPSGRGVNLDKGTNVRWDAYVAEGMPEINSHEELLDLLMKMQDDFPTNKNGDKCYALALFPDWDGNTVRPAREWMWTYGYYPTVGYLWMKWDGSEIVNMLDDDSLYYQYLKKYNEMYRAGYIDPDSATQTFDELATKVKEGRSFFSWWTYLGNNMWNAGFDPENDYGFGLVPVNGTTYAINGYNKYGQKDNAFAIGVGAKYPERLMEFLDWYGSEEGTLLFNSQVEGVTYELVDGHPVLTEFGLNTDSDKVAPDELGGGNWNDGACKINYPLIHSDDANSLIGGEPVTSSLWQSVLSEGRNDYTNQWEETYGYYAPLDYLKSTDQLGVVVGTTYTAPADSSDIANIRGQLKTMTAAAGWQMIYAESEEEFQKIWDDMKTQIKDFGYDELTEWDMQVTQDWCDSIKAVRGE